MADFSARSRRDLAPNALTRALQALRTRSVALLDLRSGNPTQVGLSPPAAGLRALFNACQALDVYRPHALGSPAARRALAQAFQRQGEAVEPGQIMLTASTSEAYGYLFKLLCDAGDQVLIPAPSYPLMSVLAELEQVEPVAYRLAYDGQWHIDPGALRRAIGPRTRALVIVNPNNPTGSFLKPDEWTLLRALRLPIISDEVFAPYALSDAPPDARCAALAAETGLVFRLGGLSKALALPQLKLAWTRITGPRAAVAEARARLEHIADAYLSCASWVQEALPELLSMGSAVREPIQARCQHNLAAIASQLGACSPVSLLTVEGGWYAVLRLPEVQTDEDWALTFLEQDHVLVQPGYLFDFDYGAHIVVSLITPEDQLRAGLARMLARVDAWIR